MLEAPEDSFFLPDAVDSLKKYADVYRYAEIRKEDQLPFRIVESLKKFLEDEHCQIYDIFAGGVFNSAREQISTKEYSNRIPNALLEEFKSERFIKWYDQELQLKALYSFLD